MINMIQIDNHLINPAQIIHVDLNGSVAVFIEDDGYRNYRAVVIHMSAASGEFGSVYESAGGIEPYSISFSECEYDLASLRQQLEGMFNVVAIDLSGTCKKYEGSPDDE